MRPVVKQNRQVESGILSIFVLLSKTEWWLLYFFVALVDVKRDQSLEKWTKKWYWSIALLYLRCNCIKKDKTQTSVLNNIKQPKRIWFKSRLIVVIGICVRPFLHTMLQCSSNWSIKDLYALIFWTRQVLWQFAPCIQYLRAIFTGFMLFAECFMLSPCWILFDEKTDTFFFLPLATICI